MERGDTMSAKPAAPTRRRPTRPVRWPMAAWERLPPEDQRLLASICRRLAQAKGIR